MSRFVNSLGAGLQNSSYPSTGSSGSVSLWLRPQWNSGDGALHVFWDFSADGSHASPSFQRFSDNNIYCGFAGFAAGEQRIILADTGLFVSGVWAHWLFTWTNGGTHSLYKNGVLLGTTATGTANGQAGFVTAGNYQTLSALTNTNADLAELTYWNAKLSADEAGYLANGGKSFLIRTASLVSYWPLLGAASPEPDLVGGFSLTLSGTVQDTNPPLVDFTPAPDIVFGPPLLGPWLPYVETDCPQSLVALPPVVAMNVNQPEVVFGPPFPGAPWQTYTEEHDVSPPPTPTVSLVYAPDVVFGPPLQAPWQTYAEQDQAPNPIAGPAPGSTPNLWMPEIHFGPPLPGSPWATILYVEADDRQAPAIRPPGPPGPLPAVAGKHFLERVPDIKGPAAQDRLRRHTEMLANIVNSLVSKGILLQTGPSSWTITASALSGGGFTGST